MGGSERQIPIPFSIYENEYVSNLRCTVEDPLTEKEMEVMKTVDRNCRLVKGQVFLWEGAKLGRPLGFGRHDYKVKGFLVVL